MALLGEFARPGSVELGTLRALQFAAARARSDAEAATARLADEPAGTQFTLEMAQRVIAAVARLAHAELALHALDLAQDTLASSTKESSTQDSATTPAGSRAQVEQLGAAVGEALGDIAIALRTLRAPGPIPALRTIYSELPTDQGLRNTPLIAIADQLVDAVKTLDSVLRDRLPA